MYALVTTSRFDHRIAKFNRAHPDLNAQLAQVLQDLEADPFKPHLRLHPLKGQLEGLHALSLTHAYRITLMLNVRKKQVILLDIGSHDEMYR
jgi:mRNA interferase YafQ